VRETDVKSLLEGDLQFRRKKTIWKRRNPHRETERRCLRGGGVLDKALRKREKGTAKARGRGRTKKQRRESVTSCENFSRLSLWVEWGRGQGDSLS